MYEGQEASPQVRARGYVSEGGLEPIAYASVLSAEFALDADRPARRIGG
jgi:hypothetical protein